MNIYPVIDHGVGCGANVRAALIRRETPHKFLLALTKDERLIMGVTSSNRTTANLENMLRSHYGLIKKLIAGTFITHMTRAQQGSSPTIFYSSLEEGAIGSEDGAEPSEELLELIRDWFVRFYSHESISYIQ